LGAEVGAGAVPVPEGVGLEANAVVLGGAVDTLVGGGRGLRTARLAVFMDDGAAVPRYGTVITGIGFVRIVAGVEVARTAPFADPG